MVRLCGVDSAWRAYLVSVVHSAPLWCWQYVVCSCGVHSTRLNYVMDFFTENLSIYIAAVSYLHFMVLLPMTIIRLLSSGRTGMRTC